MKKLSSLIILFSFLIAGQVGAVSLSEKLKGKILLQVEDVGQAWYIDPATQERAFLGRPADAFKIMRELGLGISEISFESFKNKAPEKLSGKILLRVEANGEAYYVFPDDLKLHYLGRPADAFQIMREKGLGIKNSDLINVPIFEKYSEQIIANTEAVGANTQALLDMQKQLDAQQQLIEALHAQKEQEKKEMELKPLTAGEINEKVSPAVVFITTQNSNLIEHGSGVIIDSAGFILTNAHVVSGFKTVQIDLLDGRSLTGKVLGVDEIVDLAIVKILDNNLPFANLGNSDIIKQGDNVYTLGYSEGYSDDVSIKEGIYARSLTLPDVFNNTYLEHTAEMQHGNSGGPLVNEYGFIVGINTRVEASEATWDPLKLSIPINTANNFIPLLKDGRMVSGVSLPAANPSPIPDSTPTPTPEVIPEPEPDVIETGTFIFEMDKVATPSRDVRAGDNDVVLATIKMTSNGEDATTAYIKDAGDNEFIISGTGLGCNEFKNTKLRDVDSGVAYDVTVVSGLSACLCTIDEEITFTKDVTRTFELRTDLNASTETNYPAENDTLQVTLKSGAFSITGDVSDTTIITDPVSITSAVAIVVEASLVVQQINLCPRTIVPGTADSIVYRANLEVGDSSYVDITSVKISATGTSIIAFDDDNITKLDLYINGQLVKSKSGAIIESASARNYIVFNSLSTAGRRIIAGYSTYMEVKATFSSTFPIAKTGLFELGLESTTDSIVVKDMDSNAVVETGIIINQSSRTITLINTETF